MTPDQERLALLAALQMIAEMVYPAVYIGTDANGVAFYGGSDDASRFARKKLDTIYGEGKWKRLNESETT